MMHKAIMAFSLGLNIAQSSFSVRFFINSQDEFFPDIKIFKLHRWKLSSCPAWCSAWQVPLVWLLVSFRLSHHMPLLASPIGMGELLVNLTFPYPSVSPSQSSLAGSWQEDKWCHFADCSFFLLIFSQIHQVLDSPVCQLQFHREFVMEFSKFVKLYLFRSLLTSVTTLCTTSPCQISGNNYINS